MARILFFGPLKDVSRVAERILALPDHVSTVAALVDYITQGAPELGQALSSPSVRVIVNQKIVLRNFAITDADEIAFLPPFSGG